ncbi:aminoalkylphosphonate N-acetyltransferase [Lachnospiraceae bacterium]|nr:aminoalkylphosphonate N-acetyltransferase [Lachnospiraceae bacterium]
MNIRKLNSGDYGTVYKFIVNEMEHSEVSFTDMSENLDIMKVDDSYLLYVAEYNNQVIGFVSAVKLFGCIDSCYIDITCLVVSQNFQGKGIGKSLLEFIESFGKINKIENFSVTSGLHRKEAHDFYRRNGYELGGYTFYKGLVILEKDL